MVSEKYIFYRFNVVLYGVSVLALNKLLKLNSPAPQILTPLQLTAQKDVRCCCSSEQPRHRPVGLGLVHLEQPE